MKIHPSLTQDVVIEAIERSWTTLDNPGFCISCGEERGGCEPDARNYKCEACGKHQVFGAEELMLMAM